MDFEKELSELINKHVKEKGNDISNVILARYIKGALEDFNDSANKKVESEEVKDTTFNVTSYEKEVLETLMAASAPSYEKTKALLDEEEKKEQQKLIQTLLTNDAISSRSVEYTEPDSYNDAHTKESFTPPALKLPNVSIDHKEDGTTLIHKDYSETPRELTEANEVRAISEWIVDKSPEIVDDNNNTFVLYTLKTGEVMKSPTFMHQDKSDEELATLCKNTEEYLRSKEYNDLLSKRINFINENSGDFSADPEDLKEVKRRIREGNVDGHYSDGGYSNYINDILVAGYASQELTDGKTVYLYNINRAGEVFKTHIDDVTNYDNYKIYNLNKETEIFKKDELYRELKSRLDQQELAKKFEEERAKELEKQRESGRSLYDEHHSGRSLYDSFSGVNSGSYSSYAVGRDSKTTGAYTTAFGGYSGGGYSVLNE